MSKSTISTFQLFQMFPDESTARTCTARSMPSNIKKIVVTQRDINRSLIYYRNGGRDLANNCPIARAARRAFDANVAVDGFHIRVGGGEGGRTSPTDKPVDWIIPESGRVFVDKLDISMHKEGSNEVPGPITFIVTEQAV
jgi:hypothetical protein